MKIKYKLMAALVAAFSLFCLALPASAAYGNNSGATFSPGHNYTGTPYGAFNEGDDFAWRVNLYVSANPDGKINKANDVIGSTALPLVGSVFCTSPEYTSKGAYKYPTFIQTNYTDTGRTSFSPSGVTPGTLSYTLPTLQKFIPDIPYYHDASGNTVAIANAGKISLFNGQYKSPTNFDNIQKMHFIKNNILHNVEKRIKYRKMQTIFPTTENLSKNSI